MLRKERKNSASVEGKSCLGKSFIFERVLFLYFWNVRLSICITYTKNKKLKRKEIKLKIQLIKARRESESESRSVVSDSL